jgi:hypothetical protein
MSIHMQTNTKTKLVLAVLFGVFMAPLFSLPKTYAATLSGDLTQFTLSEDPNASNHEARFTLTLDPEPTDQVTTTFGTNGECVVGYNFTDYTTGGSVVTQNGSLPFGIRALDDSEGEGVHTCDITFTSSSAVAPAYATPVQEEYSLQVVDNDTITSYDFSLSTLTVSRLEEGDSFVEQYQIDISEPPIYDITVTAVADDQCDLLSGTPESRTKNATAVIKTGTTQPIRFTLIPVQDSVFEGLHRCTITHTTSTTDPNFAAVPVSPYSATIVDDEINESIPDSREYEGGLIYFRDANFDGIDDEEQPNVISFINPSNGARQGVFIADALGNLLNGCSFAKPVTAQLFDDASSSLESSQGRLELEVTCSADVNYHIVWLLHEYSESADNWTIYDDSQAGSLTRLSFDAQVFNLGNDFTTALSIEMDELGLLSIVQSNNSDSEISPTTTQATFEESLSASVNNSRLNPIAIISAVTALGTIFWILYRQFFSNVDTVKSRYPRVDRF